jgi:inner membrane protein
MLKKGHTGIAMLLYSPIGIIIAESISTPIAVICGLFTIAGSGLPDIDSQVSIVKHRGFTHTVWFTGLVGVASGIIFYLVPGAMGIEQYMNVQPIHGIIIGLSVSYGVLTHIIGDMITPRGIKPFTPITPRDIISSPFSDKKYTYEITKASSTFYNNFFMAIGSISLSISLWVSQTSQLPF